MTRLPVLLVALLLIAGIGLAAPTVQSPLPFDHASHARIFDRKELVCTDCHLVGLAVGPVDAPQAPALPPPATSSCHGCHLGEFRGAPRSASDNCIQCHPVPGELLPSTHQRDWVTRHGSDARARGATCKSCHDTSQCIDCHDKRGPVVRNPHPPGFSRTHGVDARLDPMSCTSCHTADACASCHVEGVRPW